LPHTGTVITIVQYAGGLAQMNWFIAGIKNEIDVEAGKADGDRVLIL
jgi:hypothetical protein